MIHPSGTFNYVAEFTSESFKESDATVLHGTSINITDEPRLIGHHPMIRFWRDRLVLVAADKSDSNLRNCSFPIGDAAPLCARAGDRLHLVRTGSGGIGLSLLREERLILAIGAVTAVSLGVDIKVNREPKLRGSLLNRVLDTQLNFQVGPEKLIFHERGIRTIGDYQIYIEYCWEDGIPGVDECVSIWDANDPALATAAVRSGVLLGNGGLKLTRWDGKETWAGFR